jgi:hypothetical protein
MAIIPAFSTPGNKAHASMMEAKSGSTVVTALHTASLLLKDA